MGRDRISLPEVVSHIPDRVTGCPSPLYCLCVEEGGRMKLKRPFKKEVDLGVGHQLGGSPSSHFLRSLRRQVPNPMVLTVGDLFFRTIRSPIVLSF